MMKLQRAAGGLIGVAKEAHAEMSDAKILYAAISDIGISDADDANAVSRALQYRTNSRFRFETF